MAGSWRRLRGLDEKLTAQPGYALVGVLRIPQRRASPARVISRRVVVAVVALLLTAGIHCTSTATATSTPRAIG
ncbi:cation transporter [Mycobacterium tuberculosis RGTB423]|nr:cation transporter [Mycobacterium tuberculosis RGTB423]